MNLDPNDSPRDQLGAWRWMALLLFALVAPIGLPAAKSERHQAECRRRLAHDPLVTCSDLSLYTAPDCAAPVLCHVQAGEPVRIVRGWTGDDGRFWIQAKLGLASGRARRGWIAWDG